MNQLYKYATLSLTPAVFCTLFLLVGWSAAQGQNEEFGTTSGAPIGQPVDVLPSSGATTLSSAGSALSSDSLELKKRPQKLTVFGYYRLFLYGRNMTNPYPNLAPFQRAYSVGDGYREPMLSLNVLGRPNGRTAFGTEMFFFTPYLGTGPVDNTFSVNLGLNFYGNFRTNHGKFGIRAGGIHWYNLSPFTIGVYQILDRFSIFDRTPWEGVTNTEKYTNYFNSGSVDRGDLRWNTQAFQGLILDGVNLPGDMSFDLFWGKMQPNGGLPFANTEPNTTVVNPGTAGNVPTYIGFAGNRQVLPSFITGGKLRKTFGPDRNQFTYNVIYSETALDSLSRTNFNYQVHSLSMDVNVGEVNVSGELAMGNYDSPTTNLDWGEALMLRFRTPESYTFLPLDVQLYQISANFFNQNGEILTNSNPVIQADAPVPIAAGQASIGGLITQVGQLAHNRRGINVNTGIDAGPLRVNLGWGLAGELDTLTSDVSFIHRVNGLALSRIYNPFPENAVSATRFGPYNRQFSFFRGVFEQVQTTDLDPATAEPTTLKYYNAVDLQAKLKLNLIDRPFYVFYLGTLGSAKSRATALPNLDADTYLAVQYHEVDVYYELLPGFIVTLYYGLERAQGGRFTEWGENQLPRDQTGLGLGAGFDWTIDESTGIYFRYRYMDFEDPNFIDDTYRGNEITIELKTYF